jgi:hypothetical protein
MNRSTAKIFTLSLIIVPLLLVKCRNDMTTNPAADASGFYNEQKVTINGYSGDPRSPFISKDDNYLFFDSWSKNENMDIYYAEKIDNITFNFLGEVKGCNSNFNDFCATMDSYNNFYFISMRDLDSTHNATLFGGTFDNGIVSNLHKISGTINSPNMNDLNYDVNISSDGNILLTTSIILSNGSVFDKDIKYAMKTGLDFNTPVYDNANDILFNINTTEANECCAELSSDGLELFYSQYSIPFTSKSKLLYAKRKSINDPFSEPILITEPVNNDTTSSVWAPSLSADGKRLYYYKFHNRKYSVYMISRD